jgi:tRNA G18 (ribose-2'-O)-methylase SpoU
MSPEWLEHFRPALEAYGHDVRVYVAEASVLHTLVGFHLHQGVMATGKLPQFSTIEGLLASSAAPHLFLAIDGLANAENIGVIVRNAAAFGLHGLLVGETSSSPYLRRAVRNSMGNVFHLPIVHCTHLRETLLKLRTEHGFSIIAAHPHTDLRIDQVDFRNDCCIVLGSEGDGISPAILEVCDRLAAIPMHGGVDSINVANACAVFLYEATRQRTH